MRKIHATLAAGSLLLLVFVLAARRSVPEPAIVPARRSADATERVATSQAAPRLVFAGADAGSLAREIRAATQSDPLAWMPAVEHLLGRDRALAEQTIELSPAEMDRHAVAAWTAASRSAPDPASRLLAVRALSRSSSAEALTALRTAARFDGDPLVREAASAALPPAPRPPRTARRSPF